MKITGKQAILTIIIFIIIGTAMCFLIYYGAKHAQDDTLYVTYIDGHPELTIQYIDYDINKKANIAYNIGTGVIYCVSKDGTIYPLYNSDGSLMLYDDSDVIAVSK